MRSRVDTLAELEENPICETPYWELWHSLA